MDLENVNGIIIWEDGIPHSFGVNKMAPHTELGDENYHATSFMMDIYPTKWFQETGFPYQKEKGFLRQLDTLSAYGFTTLCNGSSFIEGQEPYYSYFINVPINLSEATREYLASIYEELKALIEKNHAYFEGNVYDENGDYAGLGIIYNLDEFYDTLGISKKQVTYK